MEAAGPAALYLSILTFLASNPTPEQLAEFTPPTETQERLRILLARNRAGQLTPAEQAELDQYERIEHLIVMLKAGSLPYLGTTP
jgi:hypothetical protein